MKITLLLAAALTTTSAALLVSPAHGEPAKRRACTFANARKTTVTEINAHPRRYYNHCVQVRGGWSGYTLYESGLFAWRGEEPSIGIDAPEKLRPKAGPPSSREVLVVGYVSDCEAIRRMVDRSFPDQFVMVSGACHMEIGPRLYVEDVRFLPPKPTGTVPPVPGG